MSFGLLFLGVALGISGINAAIDNQKMKNYSYKIDEKGRPTWIDREGNRYIDGEKTMWKMVEDEYGNYYSRQVGINSGKVYNDPGAERRRKHEEDDRRNKKKSIEEGKLAYLKWSPEFKQNLTVEISTERVIALLSNCRGKYKKFYAKSNCGFCNYVEVGDNGIEITKEEYEKLNILFGSHIDFKSK